nr:putative gas vesicle synthesis GvpL/GvpF [uncultured bacterium]
MSLHLYGTVRAGHSLKPDLKGLRSGSVRLVEYDDLATVVSEIPDDLELGEDDARAHLSVLVSLIDGGPVLPMRIGNAAPDEASVRQEFLEPDADYLRQQLDRFEGLVEVHLDVFDDEETQLRTIVARDPELRALSAQLREGGSFEERMQLGEQIAARFAEVREEFGNRLLEQLIPLTMENAPRGRSDDERIALRWAFLLPRKDLPRFDAVVDQLRAEHQAIANMIEIGPLPPFHFVTAPVPAEETPQSAWGDGTSQSSAWGEGTSQSSTWGEDTSQSTWGR